MKRDIPVTTKIMQIALAMSINNILSLGISILHVNSKLLPQVPLARVLPYITPLGFNASRFPLHGTQLVLQCPHCRIFDVFVHHRACRTHHPAVLRTFAYHGTNFLRLFAFPYLHKRLVVDIAHAFLPITLFQSVARHHFAPRVNEEVHHTRFARQHTPSAFDIVYQSHIKPRTEPTLRMLLLQLPFYQLLEVIRHLLLIRNHVVALMEIVRIMESRRGKLHTQRQGQLIKRKHILRVMVRYRTSKTDILQPHVFQGKQGAQPLIKTARMTSQFVILLAQPLNRDTDADIRELLGKSHYTVFKPSRCRDNDTRRMFVTLFHDLIEVFTDKRLASSQVDELQLWQRL